MVSLAMRTVESAMLRRLQPLGTRFVLVWLLVLSAPRLVAAADGGAGERIYRKQCASCHGAKGEGTRENYPHPLVGNRTVDRLAGYIAKSMPEDAPGDCVGEDAEQVAAYIYDAFYSKVAQARN